MGQEGIWNIAISESFIAPGMLLLKDFEGYSRDIWYSDLRVRLRESH